MSPLDNTRALYLHWPFCPYRCSFCPFIALASHDEFMQAYHEAMKREVEAFSQQLTTRPPLTSIFFGGGTPSTYPDDLLLDMVAILRKLFVIADSEITIEINPGTVKEGQLTRWRQAGINRLSIGIQSLNDRVLHRLGRMQTAKEALSLVTQAANHFDNLSVDLMLGLPGIAPAEWKRTLARIVALPIVHVSLYFLTIHETTPIYFEIERGNITLPAETEIVDLYHWSHDFLEQHGLMRYELSNFARPGYRSRHNQVYWQRQPYRGFGISASSFDGEQRTRNEKNIARYIEKIGHSESAVDFSERLTNEQVVTETLMLGLRCTSGVRLEEVTAYLPAKESQQLHERISLLQKRGLIIEKEGTVMLTRAGLVVENEVLAHLLR